MCDEMITLVPADIVAKQAIGVLELNRDTAVNGATIVAANTFLQKYFELNNELLNGVEIKEIDE